MKITLLVENIEDNLVLLSKTIPTHAPVPVLSHVLLEANRDGFFMTATDLEFGVVIKIPSKVEEEGAVVVPGRQLIETLNTLPKQKVTLEVINEELVISSIVGKVVLKTISKEEFPRLFEEKGELVDEGDLKEFKDRFGSVLFAVSQDESRPELTGIYIGQKDEGIEIAATDGFRMALKKIPEKKLIKNGESMILSSKTISELMALKGEGGIKQYIYENANQVLFESGNITLVGRIINGNYPQYNRVIPQEENTVMEIDREEMLQNLRLVSVFARESAHIVRLKIEGGKLYLFAESSGVGQGDVSQEGRQKGEDNEISFNIKFLIDFLRSTRAKTITIKMTNGLEPALFLVDNDKTFLHVIMPVRIQD